MVKLIPIRVISWSGYRADEYPKSFILDEREVSVAEITDRWYQGENNPQFPAADYFKVADQFGTQYLIKHETGNDTWYLCKQEH